VVIVMEKVMIMKLIQKYFNERKLSLEVRTSLLLS
jgi:hypothetical protein